MDLEREMAKEITRRERLAELGPERFAELVGSANLRLTANRLHCEGVHGATMNDYRLDVIGWHRRNHPGCLVDPPAEEEA